MAAGVFENSDEAADKKPYTMKFKEMKDFSS